MPTSTTGMCARRALPAMSGGVRGFSLLEILVVVTLIAGLAAFVMPALIGDNPSKDRNKQAEEVNRLLQLSSDYSLFRGQLVALVLETDSITPLVFDIEKQDFLQPDDAALAPLELEEPFQLEWQLDATPADEVTLAQAALSVRQEAVSGLSLDEPQEESGDWVDPQVFFFPSGEATPVMLMVRHPDVPDMSRLVVDAMGRVEDPDAPQREDPDAEAF